MDALTAFIKIMTDMMIGIFTDFFGSLSFGSGVKVSSLMLAYVFLSMILKYLLGAFSDASPSPKVGKRDGHDQRRRTQK